MRGTALCVACDLASYAQRWRRVGARRPGTDPPSLWDRSQAASLPSSWLIGVIVVVLAPAVAGAARTPAVLLAKVITACAAASDI
jgi:hypothetical protein